MFVFIDIEACNRYSRASICNIGMIITDKKFKEIERLDLLINPEMEFNMGIIDIGLNEEQLRDKPNFCHFYPILKKYLNKKNIIFGHSTKSDILMLQSMCERYQLENFNFKFLCSQSFYSCLTNIHSSTIGLKDLAGIYNIDFTPHRAIEDAFATKEIFKSILSKEKLNVSQYMEKYHLNFGETDGKKIIESLQDTIIEKRVQKGISKLEKMVNSSRGKKKKYYAQLIAQYIKNYEIHMQLSEEEKVFKNQNICMNKTLERKNILLTKQIIQIIHELGGNYTNDLDKCTMYISSNEATGDHRLKSYLKVMNLHQRESNIIDFAQFMDIINKYIVQEQPVKELIPA